MTDIHAFPLLSAALWGILHGLTPHGHSWLVLLPFVLGGVDFRNMVRLSLAYGLGMVLTASVIGLLLGAIFKLIPEHWHHGMELGIGGLLVLLGLFFMVRPASVHHAIDHMCSEHCHSDGEQKLLKSGTTAGLFLLGIFSMLIPCPTNIPLYSVLAVTRSPWSGLAIFTTYAIATSITVAAVALGMTRTRKMLAPLESRQNRLLIMRISGLIVVLAGAWMLWTATHETHDEHARGARPAIVATVGQR